MARKVRRNGVRGLGNVHRLQTFLNEHDAGPLVGTDVSITDVLAVEFADDGSVVLYTR